MDERPAKLYYTFEMFAEDVELIANTVRRREQERALRFRQIYTPFNGGAVLAACLAYRLSDPEQDGHKVKIMRDTPSSFDPEILVVDDIADTGKTLQDFHGLGFYIATIFKHPQSSFEPSLWVRAKGDAWVEFWWEAQDLLINHQRI